MNMIKESMTCRMLSALTNKIQLSTIGEDWPTIKIKNSNWPYRIYKNRLSTSQAKIYSQIFTIILE